jgi:hypothetical protein
MFVAAELIRSLETASQSGSSPGFDEGDKVECLYKGKGTKWFSGKVSRVNRDGSFEIKYDDGDSESGALRMNVRTHPDNTPSKSIGFEEGAKVKCSVAKFVLEHFTKLLVRSKPDIAGNLNFIQGSFAVFIEMDLSILIMTT